MNKQNNDKKSWWQHNKKKVYIACGIAITVGIGIVVFKNKNAITTFLKKQKSAPSNVKPILNKIVTNAAKEITAADDSEIAFTRIIYNNGQPFVVQGFIRNLPEGQHPSPEKIARALELGIVLGENQTYVESYLKNVS